MLKKMSIKTKLTKRRCKQCGDVFTQWQPLQSVCGYACGIEYAKAMLAKKLQRERKEFAKELLPTVYSKEYKADLQREINRLAKMIDAKFGFNTCIDCGKSFGKQTDAAHFNDVGGNSSLRYNLHNIHSANSQCNKFSSKHHSGYELGLKQRYSEDYFNYVNTDIILKFKHVKLTPNEVVEKLAIVRKLIRDFDTFQFTSAINARNVLNEIIGIYKN